MCPVQSCVATLLSSHSCPARYQSVGIRRYRGAIWWRRQQQFTHLQLEEPHLEACRMSGGATHPTLRSCQFHWFYFHLSILEFALNLSLFANCRSQFLLDRLGRCLKLIVSSESISCHEFASQFGLEFVLYAKKNKTYGIVNTESPACCLFQWITDRPLSRQRQKRCA